MTDERKIERLGILIEMFTDEEGRESLLKLMVEMKAALEAGLK